MEIQLGLLEAILDLLYLRPVYILGLVLVGATLYWLFQKDKRYLTVRIVLSSILLYYYLCIIFKNIVGIPTLHEFFRLMYLGETLFHPNISLIPLSNGISLEFLLNIFCMIPLGFLCPCISQSYKRLKNVVVLGLGLSFVIEISQLFTLYRATDSSDLLANVFGTMIGYFCFKMVAKLPVLQFQDQVGLSFIKDPTIWLPIMIAASAFGITFIS